MDKTHLNACGALLSEVLEPEYVKFLNCSTKKECLDELIKCITASPLIMNADEFASGIFHRESLMSTGIGMGIAIPHVRLESVKKPIMCVGICKAGIAGYASLDNEPVKYIFMIAAGKDQHEQHLKLLSSISSLLQDEKLRDMLIGAKNEKEIYKVLTSKE
ncbi:MAG TPA: PTS sugar transporter subunit IIA [Sedimentisphaerales bacterium]|nr:PTS sugar transporter subunit IIA [Sedimentisphaerales bacterium]